MPRPPRTLALLVAILAGCVSLAGIALGLLAGLALLDRVFPFPMARLQPIPAVTIADRHGHPLRVFLPPDGRRRQPVPLEQVSPVFLKTLTASEDRHFHRHPGVNPLAMLRAALMNLQAGRVVSGGSTITMQLARLCEPRPRTLWAKGVESFRALQLEWRFSKEEILQHYVNMTPYGGNVVGVAAAARVYFGKDQAALSQGEAALLTVLPRAPQGYDPVRNPGRARAARDRLLHVLRDRGLIQDEDLRRGLAQSLPERLHPAPLVAPHLAELLKALADRIPETDEFRRATPRASLDRTMQLILERRLADHAGDIRQKRLENAAVVVIDNHARALRALAGSIDYLDSERHGFINGALIQRSPGSALKPFLYALAMDQGLVVPKSYLLDIPTDIAGYQVRNYDGVFKGPITVEEALATSRNVPAVRLLAEVGAPAFLSLLRTGGLTTLRRPVHEYGLPLALGGCEVTLLELTNLYASLAAGGVWKPLALQERDEQSIRPETRLFSPEAAWLTLEMLQHVERADLPRSWRHAKDAPAVAWKTGTSFGHRDAWAVGVSRDLTIGVWVGNLDGRAEKGISGATHAGPLLFDLFRALDASPGGDAMLAPPEPLRLEEATVCAEDHLLPGPHCPATTAITVLAGRTRLERSQRHRRVFVHPATGLRVEGECLERLDHVPRIVRHYPLELAAWLRRQGVLLEAMPAPHPDCPMPGEGEAPAITSPDPRTPYRLRKDAPSQYQRVALKADAPPDARALWWYQDGRLVASGPPLDPLFLPLVPGRHELTVMDDQSRASSVTYLVE